MENEIRWMYIQGEITYDPYHQLLKRARLRFIGRGDLAILHHEAQSRMITSGVHPLRIREPGIAESLNTLAVNRVQMEDVSADIEHVLKGLRKDMEKMRFQAGQARQEALSALTDEEAARAHLQIEQKWLEKIRALDRRLESLLEGRRRIEALQVDLQVFETELKILDSENRMVELESGIRTTLLDQ